MKAINLFVRGKIKSVSFKLPDDLNKAVDWLYVNNNPNSHTKEQIKTDIELAVKYNNEHGVTVDRLVYPYVEQTTPKEAWDNLIVELAKSLRIDKLVEWFSDWQRKRQRRKDIRFLLSVTTCSHGEPLAKCTCPDRDWQIAMFLETLENISYDRPNERF